MKKFTYCGILEFYMENDSWSELTKDERERFNINRKITNYMINSEMHKEFMVVGDSFSKNINDVDAFYNICKNNMIANNFEIIEEEKFIGRSLVSGDNIEAWKAFVKRSDAKTQTSYFMRLSGNTHSGYLYGCLTIDSISNHDENESILVEAITNWKYVDIA